MNARWLLCIEVDVAVCIRCEGERRYRTLISLPGSLATMRRVVNYHSSWARQRQVELFDASGNPGFTAVRGFNPAGGAPGGCEGERQYRTLISLLGSLATMRRVVNYHSSWVRQRQLTVQSFSLVHSRITVLCSTADSADVKVADPPVVSTADPDFLLLQLLLLLSSATDQTSHFRMRPVLFPPKRSNEQDSLLFSELLCFWPNSFV
ncbi:hypothetical protein F511_33259 [Dorcoceras hygrometricum]|uniref:Uncharacterized protein n=1 Tax=Dorcoceras hygrometricum TaxID=472368 RepID=A0A2Z7AM23_9LAMI|nr:hypothetical protein F511_33259 [Dorcoceras hygrometricum]